MKMLSPVLLGLSLAVAGSTLAAAQDATFGTPRSCKSPVNTPSPTKTAWPTTRRRAPLSQAMTKAKFPAYYVGLNFAVGQVAGLVPDQL